MMRKSAELLDDTPSSPPSPPANSVFARSSSARTSPPPKVKLSDDGGMDLDEKTPIAITYDDMIARTIAYGRELNTEFNEEHDPKLRELFKETMKDLFGMLAYKDPRQSPAARWLEAGERGKVAEGLNGAILGESIPPSPCQRPIRLRVLSLTHVRY